MNGLVMVAVLVPLLLVVVGVAAAINMNGGSLPALGDTEPATTTVTVTMTIYGSGECPGSFGYIDVPGAAVTITDELDEVVGRSSLPLSGTGYGTCAYTTQVYDVPTDRSTYHLTIGRRGTLDESRSELEADGWAFEATLGL